MNAKTLFTATGFAALLLVGAGTQAEKSYAETHSVIFSDSQIVNNKISGNEDEIAAQVDRMCASLATKGTITARWCELRR